MDATQCRIVPVFDLRCASPPSVCANPDSFLYTGEHDCVFAYSPKLFFTYDVLYEFDCALQSRPRTFTSFVADKTLLYNLRGQAFASKPDFINAWWLWNEQRGLDYDRTFSCLKCADKPDEETVWTLDGTALGIRQDKFDVIPRAVPAAERMHGTRPADRILIPDSSTRELLLRFSKGSELLSVSDYATLRRGLRQHAAFLNSLFDWIDSTAEHPSTAPAGLQRVLRALAMPTPVAGLVLHPELMAPVLARAANGANVCATPADVSALCNNCPVLAALLSTSARATAEFQGAVRAIVQGIHDRLLLFLTSKCVRNLASHSLAWQDCRRRSGAIHRQCDRGPWWMVSAHRCTLR